MFCGLRQAEIARLDWRAIDLASGILTVGAEIAKTSSRRTVEIPDNARAWLALYAKESGPVWPASEEARNLWNLARIEAGFGPFFSTRAAVNQAQAGRDDLRPWPDNALRHSAISYRLGSDPRPPACGDRGGKLPCHRSTALRRAGEAGGRQEILWHPADRGRERYSAISVSTDSPDEEVPVMVREFRGLRVEIGPRVQNEWRKVPIAEILRLLESVLAAWEKHEQRFVYKPISKVIEERQREEARLRLIGGRIGLMMPLSGIG